MWVYQGCPFPNLQVSSCSVLVSSARQAPFAENSEHVLRVH